MLSLMFGPTMVQKIEKKKQKIKSKFKQTLDKALGYLL